MISVASEPTEDKAIRVKFFTKPHAWPSGVSAGQTYEILKRYTYHSPVRIVKLAGLSELALFREGCCESSHVRKRRCESQTIQNLTHSSLLNVSVLVFAPIARRERRLDACSDRLMTHSHVQIGLLAISVEVFLDVFVQIFHKDAE